MWAAIGDLGVDAKQQEAAERESEARTCACADGFAQGGPRHGGAEPAGDMGHRSLRGRRLCWQSPGSAPGIFEGGVGWTGSIVTPRGAARGDFVVLGFLIARAALLADLGAGVAAAGAADCAAAPAGAAMAALTAAARRMNSRRG